MKRHNGYQEGIKSKVVKRINKSNSFPHSQQQMQDTDIE